MLLFHHAQGQTEGFLALADQLRAAGHAVHPGSVRRKDVRWARRWVAYAKQVGGAQGALLISACVSPSEFEAPWPDGVPLQIHMMDADEWGNDDIVVARDLVDEIENAELFLYPGDGHLFADSSLSDFDQEAAALLKERVLAFLEAVG